MKKEDRRPESPGNKEEGPIQWKNVRFVPVVHSRMEFALEVRRQFEIFRPDHVAVEFPPTLREQIVRGTGRLPLLSVVHYQETDGPFIYFVIEPTEGLIEAVRLALEKEIPLHFIDRDTEGYPLKRTAMPDSYALNRIGHANYCRAYLRVHRDQSRSLQDALREKTMAYHLQRLNRLSERTLFVGGLDHLSGILGHLNQPLTEVIGKRHREGVGLAHLHRDSNAQVMIEMPFLAAEYERFRSGVSKGPVERLQVNHRLIRLAEKNYLKNNRTEISRSQNRVLFQFARNYALLEGALVPDFYQLLVSARGCADDDFAYEVWERGSDYPWQVEDPGLPVLRLSGKDLLLGEKRIRFHRQFKALRRRLVPVPVRKKAREKIPGEWERNFHGSFICSYPPEDVLVEGYGRYLHKKAMEIKSEENFRIVPFTTAILDGIDIRETIRKWPKGPIYVKEGRPLRGKVGSVVVIFDSDLPNEADKEAFPWRVTWLGEHDQESDMAFYSTAAGEVMDGPGISRCQYGGFMLTYPPMRVFDIWKDPFFDPARNKPERLLMAALDYSQEIHVVYVAADPPSGWCQGMANRLGKKIIYLPIGIFSPVTLKKIRQFHVLEGHHVRRYARHYI
ncbi:MAG: hypothetical protein ACOWYE_17485 [Desulfatiglandales bacterium]